MNYKNPIGIYIHIPFCNNICIYCDFVSRVDTETTQRAYVDRLLKEIYSVSELDRAIEKIANDGLKKEVEKNENNDFKTSDFAKSNKNNSVDAVVSYSRHKVDTIYFGGGTPSALYGGGIAEIMVAINDVFDVTNNCEITVECNPESVTRDKMLEYKNCGINRISMGLQCADDAMLKMLGRRHSVKDYKDAVEIVKAHFENFSTDLILGLPLLDKARTHRDIVTQSIDLLLLAQPKHISAYALKVEEGTPLQSMAKDLDLADDDTLADLYDMLVTRLEQNGYYGYEISNFCKNNFESLHNLKYWQGGDYYGFGVSAAGRLNNIFTKNTDSIDDYVAGEKTQLSFSNKSEMMRDYIMLGLRLHKGISLNDFKNKFDIDLLSFRNKEIEQLKSMGMLKISDEWLYIPKEHLYVSNSIILKVLGDL